MCRLPFPCAKNRITAKGDTALGGDNRTGVACLVTLATTLLERKLSHPPLTLLFTVREESGLFGARYLDPADLGGVTMGFNVDGKGPAELTVGAVGAERWEVEIVGRAAHAGVHPEQGISATLTASMALAEAGAAVGSARFAKAVAKARPTSACSAAATARARARPPTSSPITSIFAASRGATIRRS